MPLRTKLLSVTSWLVPGFVAIGALVGLVVHFSFPGGHPPLSAYVFAPTVLAAIVLSPLGLAAAIACVRRSAPHSMARALAWAAVVLNSCLLLVSLTIWRAG